VCVFIYRYFPIHDIFHHILYTGKSFFSYIINFAQKDISHYI